MNFMAQVLLVTGFGLGQASVSGNPMRFNFSTDKQQHRHWQMHRHIYYKLLYAYISKIN